MTDDRSKKAVEAFAENGVITEDQAIDARKAFQQYYKWGIFFPSAAAWAAKAAYWFATKSAFDGDLTWQYAKASYDAAVDAGITTRASYDAFVKKYEDKITMIEV